MGFVFLLVLFCAAAAQNICLCRCGSSQISGRYFSFGVASCDDCGWDKNQLCNTNQPEPKCASASTGSSCGGDPGPWPQEVTGQVKIRTKILSNFPIFRWSPFARFSGLCTATPTCAAVPETGRVRSCRCPCKLLLPRAASSSKARSAATAPTAPCILWR